MTEKIYIPQRHWIKKSSWCLFFFVLLTIPLLFLPVTASNVTDLEKEIIEEGKGLSWIEGAEYPDCVDIWAEQAAYDHCRVIFSGGIDASLMGVLSMSNGVRDKVKSAIKAMFGLTKSLGLAILVVLFIMELSDKVTHQGFEFEYFIRLLIRYFIAKTLMDSGTSILNTLVDIGTNMAGTTTIAGAGNEEFLARLAACLQDASTMECMGFVFVSFVPYLLYKLAGLVISCLSYGVVIEVILRGGFAPIGCASMAQEGFSGHGLRYIKKFFSACIRGVVILCCFWAAGILTTPKAAHFSSIGSIGGFAFEGMIITFTAIMAAMKAGSIADDIAMV